MIPNDILSLVDGVCQQMPLHRMENGRDFWAVTYLEFVASSRPARALPAMDATMKQAKIMPACKKQNLLSVLNLVLLSSWARH